MIIATYTESRKPPLNRYYRRSRIAEAKFRLLIRHFALDLCAADAAQLTSISHRSFITIFGKIRRRIAEECERASPFSACEVEVDESYFGPRRARGRRGRGTVKTIVFGIFKRNGCVYTEVVPEVLLQEPPLGDYSPPVHLSPSGNHTLEAI